MTAEQIAGSLTEAQKRALSGATYSNGDGAWHPGGWYVAADKRVRRALTYLGLTREWVRHSNRLTPLGIEVKAILERQSQ
jgi:hypothetical protein